MRNAQMSKDDLLEKHRGLQNEIEGLKSAHESRENRLVQENKDNTAMLEERYLKERNNTITQMEDQHGLQLSQLEKQHRQDILLIEEKHRQEIHAMERLRDDLQAEISKLRGVYEQEKYKVNQANGDIDQLERDKRLVEEAVHERG